jgi:hypothetical protein
LAVQHSRQVPAQQCPLLQSPSPLQVLPLSHLGQLPPQSTSVSSPFLRLSKQVAATVQTPFRHEPSGQRLPSVFVFVPHCPRVQIACLHGLPGFGHCPSAVQRHFPLAEHFREQHWRGLFFAHGLPGARQASTLASPPDCC